MWWAIARAEQIARVAHEGQMDKVGHPYIEHPARVATIVRWTGRDLTESELDVAIAAAWLHDVVEDTGFDLNTLRMLGIPGEVARTVDLMTRKHNVPSEEYYRALALDPVGLALKHADMIDNLDPHRTSLLSAADRARLAEKYRKAAECLGVNPEEYWHPLRALQAQSNSA